MGMQTIAFVADAVYPFNKGGKETRLYEISRRLRREDREVRIYTMKWWQGPDRLLVDGVWLHALCPRMPLYAGTRRSMRQALIFGLSTLKLVRERFDVCEVDHMPFFPLFAARLACALRRRPMFATWHEVWGKHYWRKYLGTLGSGAYLVEAMALRMPDRIISASQHTTERLLAWRPGLKVETVPAGVDLAAAARAEPSRLQSDILFTGRLLAHKNVDLLLQSVARLAGERPGLRCVVVGEGPERPRLEALARELGIEGNVRFFDFFPDQTEVFSLMKSSSVLVLPSEREGFGLVVLEANACGLPAVTVRHPDNAAARLIEPGVNGVLADLNAGDLARSIVRCLDDPLPVPAARLAGRDWESVARKVEAILFPAAPRPVAP